MMATRVDDEGPSRDESQLCLEETEKFESAVLFALRCLQSSDLVLKPQQKEAVRLVWAGKDVFVLLPTGFGKSIIYQLLPFLFDYKLGRVNSSMRSLVIVVSPLISLMADQVGCLRRWGARAAMLSSRSASISRSLLATENDLRTCSFLFASPEALITSKWRETMDCREVSERVVAVVIDEAHCVSKWSKDFRAEYGRLHELRALVPHGTPFIACTATATRSIKQEVISSLEMYDYESVMTSPDRSNIFYEVHPRTEIGGDLLFLLDNLKWLQNQAPRAIIYCRSLNTCADLYAYFHFELGEKAYFPDGAVRISDNRLFGMFHSSTPQHNKDVILQSLTQSDGVVRVVFATVALGMGVNIKDVNLIIHYRAPHSIDDYFQESGRGGRSGDQARSLVFWKPIDCPVKKEFKCLRDQEQADVRKYLENSTICRRKWLLDFFDPSTARSGSDELLCCDICTKSVDIEQ